MSVTGGVPTPGSLTRGKPTLCIINFNGRNILPVSLPAACALADRFAAILLLDNGSQDGSAALAETDYAPLTVVRLGQNLGAGGAPNWGARQAAPQLILLHNNHPALP